MATQSPAKKPGRPSYTAPPEKRSRTPLLIGIVVGIIVIALAAAVIASRGGESDLPDRLGRGQRCGAPADAGRS